MYSSKVNKKAGVRSDQIVKLSGFYSKQYYPEKMRRIKFYDEDQQRSFVFLTNNFTLKAKNIAALYKYRWKVELFFKWIKQHLKIKSFWGNFAKCREDTSVHCHHNIYPGCNNKKQTKAESVYLRNSTDFRSILIG